MVHSWCWSLF